MSRSGGAYHVPLRLPLYGKKCPLHWAMSRIGGKWKVQILCSVANAGTIRYNALRASWTASATRCSRRPCGSWRGRPGAAAGLSGGAGAGGVQRHGRCMRLLPVLESLSDWAEAEMDGRKKKFPE